MANWLSITWEDERLLLLAAKTQGKTVLFQQLAELNLAQYPSATSGESDLRVERNSADSGEQRILKVSKPSLKKQLAEYIRQNKLGKAETVILLSRSDVEVRPMVFPPVPVEELPDLVKFQAAKEFNALDLNSPLDFFITNKLDNVTRSTLFPVVKSGGKRSKNASQAPAGNDASTGTAPKYVLASTIRGDLFHKIELFCDDLGLTLRRIVLRPCETAFLFKESGLYQPGRTTLLVELEADETSQTVIFQGEPVFMRSPKISCPDDIANPDFAARLVAELKRTRIAVRNEIQGVTADEVVLCGVGPAHEKLARMLSEGLAIPVRNFDPWENISRGGSLVKMPLQEQSNRPECFAPLIGSLLRVGRNEAADIDFNNPKKRPESIGQRQILNAVIATALALLVALLGFGFYYRDSLEREVKRLNAKRNNLTETAKIVGVERTQLKAIDDWNADNVNWFEQLGWLSRQAPPARDMMLTDLMFSANQRGSMTLKSLVRKSSIVSPMEESLREGDHDIKTAEKAEVKGNPFYGFRFNLSVLLSKNAATALPNTETEPIPSTSDPSVHNPAEATTDNLTDSSQDEMVDKTLPKDVASNHTASSHTEASVSTEKQDHNPDPPISPDSTPAIPPSHSESKEGTR